MKRKIGQFEPAGEPMRPRIIEPGLGDYTQDEGIPPPELVRDKVMREKTRDEEHLRDMLLLPPPGAIIFNEGATVTLAASASNSVVVSFQMPGNSQVGLLAYFGQQLENPADWPSVRWRLFVNRAPFIGYDNIVGQVGSIINPDPIRIVLYRDYLVEVRGSNLTASAISGVAARIKGWYLTV